MVLTKRDACIRTARLVLRSVVKRHWERNGFGWLFLPRTWRCGTACLDLQKPRSCVVNNNGIGADRVDMTSIAIASDKYETVKVCCQLN